MIWDRQYYNISTNCPLKKDKNRSSHSSLFSVGVEINKKAAVPCGALLSEVFWLGAPREGWRPLISLFLKNVFLNSFFFIFIFMALVVHKHKP